MSQNQARPDGAGEQPNRVRDSEVTRGGAALSPRHDVRHQALVGALGRVRGALEQEVEDQHEAEAAGEREPHQEEDVAYRAADYVRAAPAEPGRGAVGE